MHGVVEGITKIIEDILKQHGDSKNLMMVVIVVFCADFVKCCFQTR